MKFAIKKPDFLFALDNACGITEARATIPILRNVKLETASGALLITATDMDMQVDVEQAATIAAQGETTVPAKTLRDIVNKSAADTIECTLKGEQMHIRAGGAKFTLGVLPSVDYPLLSLQDQTAVEFEMPAAGFKRLLDRTKHAMSNEETRYYLCGVFIQASPAGNNILRGVATNGHTLGLADEPIAADTHVDTFDSIPAVILPKKAVNALSGMLSGLEGNVKITMSDNGLAVVMGNMLTLKTRVIDGTYPDYMRVIPQNNPLHSTLQSSQVIQALDRVVTVIDQKSRSVRLEFATGQGLTITAAHATDGNAAEEEIDTAVDHEKIAIGFNAQYLMDTLKNLPDAVTIEMADNASPAILHDASDPSHKYVVMPMRV